MARAGIYKAIDWLKEHGFAEKYNPYHHPKGSPKGGQFAPKPEGEGGTGEGLIHVPYKGTRVEQKGGGRVIAKEKKEKTPEKKNAKVRIPKIPESAGFKSLGEAQKWVQDHVAENLDLGKRNLNQVNSILATIRHIEDTGDNMPKLSNLQLSASFTPDSRLGGRTAGGYYFPDDKHIELAHDCMYSGGISTHNQMMANYRKSIRQYEKQAADPRLDVSTRRASSEWAGQFRKMLDEFRSGKERKADFSKMTVSGGGANGVMAHEFGHAWHYENRHKVEKELGLKWQNEKPPGSFVTTKYSDTNHKECFAEAFAIYHKGRTDGLDDKLVKFFDKEFPKLNYGGTAR